MARCAAMAVKKQVPVLRVVTDAPERAAVDLLAVGVEAGRWEEGFVAELDRATGGDLLARAKEEGFEGKPGQRLKLPVGEGVSARWVVLVGLDAEKPAAARARSLAVLAARSVQKQKHLGLLLPDPGPESIAAAAEGVVTGAYQYLAYRTGERAKERSLQAASLLVPSKVRGASKALRRGRILGESINLARDLVNAPPNDLTPSALAEEARKQARAHGLKCTVWNRARIEKEGMHLFAAVARGSGEEPRFVHLVHKPAKLRRGAPKVAFVGKGLTFDSGGLCIKPAGSMLDMKCDMAGAATTLGVLVAAARLELPIEVHGLIGATENMSGDHAYRPGDVFRSYAGKTVEIINTDAEGRLVLADVLAYADKKVKPDFIVDHATLTGACMVALGSWTAGFFASDEELAARYLRSAEEQDESMWRMPLSEDLKEGLRSSIADLKHTGERWGGAISAALFLQEFVGGRKWAHVDIAGPAFLSRAHGNAPKGGTGFGVAAALRFLERCLSKD